MNAYKIILYSDEIPGSSQVNLINDFLYTFAISSYDVKTACISENNRHNEVIQNIPK